MLEKERTRFTPVAIRHWNGLVSPSLSQAISLARFAIAIAASFTLPKFTANQRFALHWLVARRLLQAGVHVCFLHFAPPFHKLSALQPLENGSYVLSIRGYLVLLHVASIAGRILITPAPHFPLPSSATKDFNAKHAALLDQRGFQDCDGGHGVCMSSQINMP
jgi:hypothetical protein